MSVLKEVYVGTASKTLEVHRKLHNLSISYKSRMRQCKEVKKIPKQLERTETHQQKIKEPNTKSNQLRLLKLLEEAKQQNECHQIPVELLNKKLKEYTARICELERVVKLCQSLAEESIGSETYGATEECFMSMKD